jgi:hypothetical protein
MRATHCGIVVAAALNFLRMCNDSDYLSGQKMWLTPVFYLPVGLGPSTRSAFFFVVFICWTEGRHSVFAGRVQVFGAAMNETLEIAALRKAVEAQLTVLRAALGAYRRAARRPPLFLHERAPVRMRDDALTRTQVFSDRNQMMRMLASGRVGAEVGVQAGDFSRFLLDELPLTRLHLHDLAIAPIRADVKSDPRVSLHAGDSSRSLASLPPSSLDWAYIDGDHSFAGAMKDARAALHAVKPGGILFFNDYTRWSPGEAIPYGVVAVVHELVNEGHDMIAVALTPSGYFDVALRR